MQPDIQNWLNDNRDYQAGLVLLQKHGKTGFIINLLQKGPDAYNTPRMLVELQKLAESRPPLTIVVGQPDEKVAIKTVSEPATSNSAPRSYVPDQNLEKKLRINALLKNLWKELTHLHGQLSVLPEGEKLHETAALILTKNLKRQDLWDQLHYFEQNGVWFDELPGNQPKPFDLEQSIKNLMSSRAKAKKILEKPVNKAKREHTERRIAEFDKQLETLRLQRNER